MKSKLITFKIYRYENEGEEEEAEGEDSAAQELELPNQASPTKSESPVKTIEPPLDLKPTEANEEEKIETDAKESHIDDPIDLQKLLDTEDVIFEFYYNRLRINSFKTIYELINYQPTYRSVSDPHVIYYKIVDREQKDKDCGNSDEK
jgi:hypothetical protein